MDKITDLTIQDLLQNPFGKGSAVGSIRKTIIDDLHARYVSVMQKNNNRMSTMAFKTKDEEYILYIQVPAENLPGLTYDVFLKFTPHAPNKNDIEAIKGDRTLARYRLQLFSNSPNFMYTYTYVLNKNGMIIPELIQQCSKIALVQAPSTKNPVESYGFEKSCYFAALYLKERGYLNKALLDAHLSPFSTGTIRRLGKHQEVKLKENQLLNKQKKKTNKEAKRAAQKNNGTLSNKGARRKSNKKK